MNSCSRGGWLPYPPTTIVLLVRSGGRTFRKAPSDPLHKEIAKLHQFDETSRSAPARSAHASAWHRIQTRTHTINGERAR